MLTTIEPMANKKTKTDDSPEARRTPRRTMQIPADWFTVINKMVAETGQPHLWVVLKAVAQRADELGIEHPELPWKNTEE